MSSSNTCEIWEKKLRNELVDVYKRFFKNNDMIQITYEEFVFYCYNHTLGSARSKYDQPNK